MKKVMRQAQVPIDTSVAQAVASRNAMSRLLTTAGHDLKQPLQVALMTIERVAEGGVKPQAAASLRIALDALSRLNSELDDLAFSSLVGTDLGPKSQHIHLRELLAEVEKGWRFYADACGITLRIRCPDVIVVTDSTMLRTILRNLVGNALKYCGRRGRVFVGCRMRENDIVVEVRDNGCGIAPGRLETIFNAFDRGGRMDRTDGLGLGLHIVRQTADALGRSVSVRSTVDRGSVFSIRLPRSSRPHVEAALAN